MAQTEKAPSPADAMARLVERSVCSVHKKDMSDDIPVLSSTDTEGLDLWAKVLLFWLQAGSKGKKEPSEQDNLLYFQALKSIIGKIGTHGFKTPIPEVSTAPFFTPLETANYIPDGILCEAMLPRSLLYSGDSAQMRQAKFLMARALLDGAETNVLEQLLKGTESAMVAALSRNGMPESCCKEVSDAYQVHLKQDLAKVPIHPLTKQVYFEEEGCEDVILVPVAAETIIREIHRQSQTGGRWLASRTLCAVGGANPVNGGSLCNDLGGAFLLLMAEPPNRTDPSLAARLKRGGKIYTRFSIRQEDIMTFIKAAPLEQLVGNDEKIKKELNAYNWFAGVLLAPLIDASHLTDDGILHSGENGAIGRFLDQCEGERNDPSVVADAVADVFNYIAQTYKELSAHSADSTCRAFLIEKMTEALL